MSSGSFDRVFRLPQTVTKAHYIGMGAPLLTKADLDAPSCPSCYRPGFAAGYCERCTTSGAAERHQANREAGW